MVKMDSVPSPLAMLCQRSVNGIGAVLPGALVLSLHARVRVILLIQMISVVPALPLTNAATSMDAGGTDLTRDVHSTAPSDHASDAPYFYCPYPGYDDWVMPGQNQTPIDELNENNQIQHINLYNVSNHGPITYDILHTFWTRLAINAYVVKVSSRHDNNKPSVVRAVLKMLWTIDKKNTADNVRIIAIRERHGNDMLPEFVDVGDALSQEDRWRVLQNTLQEAFDYWSAMLSWRVVFQYVEYDASLRNSTHFHRVIIASMQDRIHVDEHSNVTEGFANEDDLAHASAHFIHFNRKTPVFYIAPHLNSTRVYIARQNKDGITNATTIVLHAISSEELAKRYTAKTYTDLYKQCQTALRSLLYRNNTMPECLLSTAVHETGHVIGFGHTSDPQSVMYEFKLSNSVVHYEGDKRAARELYADLINRAETIERNNLLVPCHSIPSL